MGEKIEKSKILIVEGVDEKNVFEYWYKKLNIEDIQVMDIGGKDKFRSKMPILVKDRNYKSVESIGIVRDADEDAEQAFRSVCGVLKNCKIPQPIKPLIATSATPKLNIFIAKGKNNTGSLESLFIETVKGSSIFECVSDYFDCVKEKQSEIPSKGKLDIAKTYVYLAANPKYSRLRFGHSVGKGLWDTSHSELNELNTFLKRL